MGSLKLYRLRSSRFPPRLELFPAGSERRGVGGHGMGYSGNSADSNVFAKGW